MDRFCARMGVAILHLFSTRTRFSQSIDRSNLNGRTTEGDPCLKKAGTPSQSGRNRGEGQGTRQGQGFDGG